MNSFEPADGAFEARVRDSFGRQSIMGLIGAEMSEVVPGRVVIELPFRADLCQQHGFFHAGVTTTIADSAGGYAAFSLFPADASVLTTEFKINLVAPAAGDRLRAVGQVVKPGPHADGLRCRGLRRCRRPAEALRQDAAKPDLPGEPAG